MGHEQSEVNKYLYWLKDMIQGCSSLYWNHMVQLKDALLGSHRVNMYDRQSQAHSIHQTSFDKRLEKALRLNCDPGLLFARLNPQEEPA